MDVGTNEICGKFKQNHESFLLFKNVIYVVGLKCTSDTFSLNYLFGVGDWVFWQIKRIHKNSLLIH